MRGIRLESAANLLPDHGSTGAASGLFYVGSDRRPGLRVALPTNRAPEKTRRGLSPQEPEGPLPQTRDNAQDVSIYTYIPKRPRATSFFDRKLEARELFHTVCFPNKFFFSLSLCL